MSARKGQNSILFLTTLSVYLGLVLVGATPQVLAQAALTRNFAIQTEIEAEDDLDKKPEGCTQLRRKVEERRRRVSFDDGALLGYVSAVEGLAGVVKQISAGHVSINLSSGRYAESLSGLSLDLPPLVLYPKGAREKLNDVVSAFSKVIPSRRVNENLGFSFDFERSNTSFNTRSGYLQNDDESARQVAVAYDSSLDLWRCESQNQLDTVILKGTEVTHQNNQVLISTHLPRASIDSLLY
jgi:hypothetical protein